MKQTQRMVVITYVLPTAISHLIKDETENFSFGRTLEILLVDILQKILIIKNINYQDKYFFKKLYKLKI